ncbi:LD-carboxypeptidase [Streptomyces sp. JL1001]|uniref:LD-carboxypeptidase n=1 Tax=Streptomyces sp. JL1001 TaxID=3078227 RepID=A0AAU8KQ74_9ACTN
MPVRYPRPLRPGDRIGVTSPSSGVPEELRERLAVAVRDVEARGYQVVTGRCMDGSGHVSAPAADRAAELTTMLTDPGIRAVVPPWGGETAIDLLPLIDWRAVRAAAPDTPSLTQHQAVLDALGPLNVPIVADVECGHVPPYLPLVNGARCRVVHTATRSEVTQTLD